MKRLALTVLLALTAFQLSQAQVNRKITTSDGLSSSLVHCLCQDNDGNIWIGTRNGLNKYDGVLIKTYRYDPLDSCSLTSNLVNAILQDSEGHLIIGTQQGLQLYDKATNSFSTPLATADGVPYRDNIDAIIQRSNGEVWAAGSRVIQIMFPEGGRPYLVYKEFSEDRLEGYICEDSAGNLWIARYNFGLYCIREDGKVSHLPQNMFGGTTLSMTPGPGRRLYLANNSGDVMALDIDSFQLTHYDSRLLQGSWSNTLQYMSNGKIMLGTDGNGSFILDPDSGEISPYVIENIKAPSSSLKIHAFLEDFDGNLWIGAYGKGVLMVPKEPNPFHYLGSESADADVIGAGAVSSLLFDSKGQLWIGTDSDGIYVLDHSGHPVYHYSVSAGMPLNIFCLHEDSSGKIWFGTYTKGVWRIDPATHRFVKSTAFSSFPNSEHSIYAIDEDSQKRLWMATMGTGLYCYDLKTGRFTVPDITRDFTLNQWQNDVLARPNSLLYVATFAGLYELDIRTDDISLVRTMLDGHIVYTLHHDGDNLYAGMADGLAVINTATGEQKIYTTHDGLPDNYITAIRSVSPGKIWISTNSGLAFFDRQAEHFERYYASDGTLIHEYNLNTDAMSPEGYVFFGGNEGIVYFNSGWESKPARKWTPKIIGFQSVGVDRPLTDDLRYTLRYDENNCTVYFTTAEYDAPAGLQFFYSTDRHNWTLLPQGQSSVTLSDMLAGRYLFAVKVVDDDVESDPVSVSILIRRPWWGSTVAKSIYFLITLLILGIIARMLVQRMRYLQEISRQKQEQMLNEEKVQFLISMSHEIRSPMTLVMAPLHQLIDSDPDSDRQRYYAVMDRNAQKILQVVDQMLDLRKADTGQIQLNLSDVNLADFASSICSLFKEQADLKGVTLTFPEKGAEGPVVQIDRSYFDKVLINLLSNALKFTPAGGSIDVRAGIRDSQAFLEVKDTGTGMSKNTLKNVFERFYRGDTSVSGTGIGMNLAKTIVDLHNGTITAANNSDGPGSLFCVLLPLDENLQTAPAAEPVLAPAADNLNPRKNTLLLAEDNDDIRQFLTDELSNDYNIIGCADGKEAYENILLKEPDLVISDVIMPNMDGLTLCKKIRHNPNISHLPVILLTAKSLEQDRIEGLDVGVDAYLTKPFSMDVLKKTVTNLLQSRNRLMVSYSEPKVTAKDIKDVDIKTPDEKLLERVMKVINDQLSDPALKVDTVAMEVGLSRVHLYRKIKELTNMTTNEFIKNIRLKKAAEMLSTGKHSIAELSEAVGFASATYFATAFKNLYGMSPSEYARSVASQNAPQEHGNDER
ncbi:MAG: response regulator [Bacteroidales bacterium]|nr:response regulator [Bacteroidales bacterium]